MRIVHVADSFVPDVGGIERQVATLALRQQAEGHDVTVITAVAEPAEIDLHVARAASGRWLTVAFPWRNRRMVAEVLDGSPIDVLHAHFTVISPMAVYVTRAASRRQIPVAATVHSLWWKVAAATRTSMLPFGWGNTRAAWSGVSTVAAGHVRRTLRAVGEVSVVPNLVDTEWWRRTPSRSGTGSPVRLIVVGRLKKRKHIDEFIDVLAEVRRRLPPESQARVRVVGAGPRHADLQRQIERLGLADWVELLGHRDAADIRTLHHESDLFVSTSRQESFGIAAFEARAAGLPVIGYRGNGLRDFIEDGVDGRLVADADEMADALTALISRPETLHRLRTNASTSPPPITANHAMQAVEDLYRRARAMYGLDHLTAAGQGQPE